MFKPEIKIEKFEVVDVITASVTTCDMDGYNCPVDMGLG